MDIDRLRAETPSTADAIHLNNAGASPTPDPVHRAVLDHLELERAVGGYEAARRAHDGALYEALAALLGAQADEIAFVENATRAWDMAFYGLRLAPGDRILTHASEYASNYMALLHRRQATGVEIDLVPSGPDGAIDADAIGELVTERTKAICLTHAASHSGLVNDAAAVGRAARRHGLFYLLDACQSAGQIDLDVGRIGCDALAGTGRKFLRGPRGTGFLFIRRDALDRVEPPFVDMRAATWVSPDAFDWAPGARRFETFEGNAAGRVGLARAARYAMEIGLPAIEARIGALAGALRAALAAIPGVRVADPGATKSGIVTFDIEGRAPAEAVAALRERSIFISATEASVARLDLPERGFEALCRASIHYFNTEYEIAGLAEAVASL